MRTTVPKVIQTRRRETDDVDTVEIVLDRALPFGQRTRFILDDGQATNVIDYCLGATPYCPIPTGACCQGTACSLQSAFDCQNLGGTYYGTDTACDVPDADGDGLRDQCDQCAFDPMKVEPGICGCGVDDTADSDGDGMLDCNDECPGIDDAVFAPDCTDAIPTISTWGVIVLSLFLLTGGKLLFRGKRPVHV